MRPVTKVILVLSVVALCVVAIWLVTAKWGTRTTETPGVVRAPVVTQTAEPVRGGAYNDPLATYQRWRQHLTGNETPGGRIDDLHSSSVDEGTLVARNLEEPVAGADPPGPTVYPRRVEGEVVAPGWTAHPPAGNVYTIAAGDTLSSISQKFYGSSQYASAIEAANAGIKPTALKIGQQITIPDKSAFIRPAVVAPIPGTGPVAVAPAVKVYEVQRNDTLIGIARRLYGDAGMYKKIYEANQDVLSSPNATLRVGQRLRLPTT
jgi:nucleoid-associated protein YgaU